MPNRLTFNANLAMLGDNEKFLRILRAWKPKTVVLMNAISTEPQSMFQRVKRDMRTWGGIVIYRRYEDGDNGLWWKYKDPAAYLDLLLRESGQDKSIWYHVHNEPLPDDKSRDDFMNWTAAIIELAVQRDIRLCVGNLAIAAMSVGVADVNKWDTLLRALGKYADRKIDGVGQILMGVHEYTHALLPWGCADRDPRDLTNPAKIVQANWPTPAEVRSKPDKNWHIYRSEWFVSRIQALTGKTPQVVITEAFHDRMPNIEMQFKDATAAIDAIAGRKVKGVPTLIQYWNNMFPQWKAVRALCEQYLWAEKLYPNYYLGFAIFSWTHHNELPDRWKDNCDVSEQDQFLNEWPVFELEHTTPTVPPPPSQPSTDLPADGWYDCTVFASPDPATIYASKDGSAIIGRIHTSAGLPARTVFMSGLRQPIDCAIGRGWLDMSNAWVDPKYPPIAIATDDPRWKVYKFAPVGGKTANVYEKPMVSKIVGYLQVGELLLEYIPNVALTAVERSLLTPVGGVVWLPVKAAFSVGFVWAKDVEVRGEVEPPAPPVEYVRIPKVEYNALKATAAELVEANAKILQFQDIITTQQLTINDWIEVRRLINKPIQSVKQEKIQ